MSTKVTKSEKLLGIRLAQTERWFYFSNVERSVFFAGWGRADYSAAIIQAEVETKLREKAVAQKKQQSAPQASPILSTTVLVYTFYVTLYTLCEVSAGRPSHASEECVRLYVTMMHDVVRLKSEV